MTLVKKRDASHYNIHMTAVHKLMFTGDVSGSLLIGNDHVSDPKPVLYRALAYVSLSRHFTGKRREYGTE